MYLTYEYIRLRIAASSPTGTPMVLALVCSSMYSVDTMNHNRPNFRAARRPRLHVQDAAWSTKTPGSTCPGV